MDLKDNENLRKNGFKGFKTVRELWSDNSCIPKKKGIYLVINPGFKKTQFIHPGVGGFFKGKNPNVAAELLMEKIVPDSQVVYIGKAGTREGSATLHSRICQYLRFGQGKNVGHWGGRYIWQLRNHQDLIFCWKETGEIDPRDMEKLLLKIFHIQFGKAPFANLVG